jgi:hypothetical protein
VVLIADSSVFQVRTAVARLYASGGTTVVEMPAADLLEDPALPGTVVVAAEDGIAEWVLDHGTAPADVGAGAAELAAKGWEVTILVPTQRIGEAHVALRRIPVHLQPWWLDAEHGVCFGVPEVP